MAYVLGIDLGTTFTAAAVCEPGGEPRMVSLGSNSYAVPSVIFMREDGTLLAGESAEMQSGSDATRVARHFKRRLGDDIPIQLGGTAFGADELASHLLRWVVDTVTERKGEAPTRIVITHPANWGSFRTDVLLNAAGQAGAAGAVLLPEPEAAAIHYVQSERLEIGAVLGVYDLGGGTFDAVVMRRTDAGFETLGRPVGIERLGGVDFDEAIRSFVIESLDFSESSLDSFDDVDIDSEAAVAAAYGMQDSCVTAKRVLSADTVAQVRVSFPELTQQVRINRAEFENRIRPRLSETLDAFASAVESAGLGIADLSRILLVGGSSRIPLVSGLLAQRFARPLAVDTDPKNTVALGAALYATADLHTAPPLDERPAVEPPAVEPPAVEMPAVEIESINSTPVDGGTPPMAPRPPVRDQAEPGQAEVTPKAAERSPAVEREPFLPPPTPGSGAAAEPSTDQGIETPVTSAEMDELLGVSAESAHRMRIPQASTPELPGALADQQGSEAEAVGPDLKLLLIAAVLVVLTLVVVGAFVLNS